MPNTHASMDELENTIISKKKKKNPHRDTKTIYSIIPLHTMFRGGSSIEVEDSLPLLSPMVR